MTVAPGFDVGAHIHGNGEEIYVIDGELDVLCFEPVDRTPPDWHAWESDSGDTFLHGLPGSFLYVPPGVPHAFANRTERPVRLFFQSSVAGGHENYFAELGRILADSHGRPDLADIKQLEASFGTEQLTAMRPGGPPRP